METMQLPPVAVTIGMPTSGHLETGQEVTLTFHAIPDRVLNNLGFALEALGGHLTAEGGNVVCRLKLVKNVTTFTPAHIRNGEMQGERQPFASDDR
ncbi:MAG: hypothetical protein V1907_02190 [Candidatus Kerfeldbacteria bacterium]